MADAKEILKEENDEEILKQAGCRDLIELMRCKNCKNLILKGNKMICKEFEKEVLLDNHCSFWEEESDFDKQNKIRQYASMQKRNKEEAELLQEYLLLTTLGRNKNWDKASEILVNYIKKNYYIFTTKNDQKTEMWIYKNGIYVPEGKSEIKEILRRILREWFSAFIYNLVMSKLEPDTFIEEEVFFKSENISEIAVKNGILNIFTRQLSNFSPKKIFFNKLNAEYKENATCPKIEKFLKEVLSNEEDIKVFYEILGFCLLKEYKFEKAFMFVGEGRNGKDKTLELIRRLFGLNNCASVSLSRLEKDPFSIFECFGKMVNLASEISNKDLKDTSKFKEMTGRSLVAGQRKFLSTINFENYAKFIFACNELPMVYDTNLAFWDRWILLEFPYIFVNSKELNENNPRIKLLLNKGLEGLSRLLKNKEFSSTKGSKEIKELWIRKANSFLAFCMDCLEEDPEGYVTKKQVRKSFNNYRKKHKLKGVSDRSIKVTLVLGWVKI